jgi:hypothetical protein
LYSEFIGQAYHSKLPDQGNTQATRHPGQKHPSLHLLSRLDHFLQGILTSASPREWGALVSDVGTRWVNLNPRRTVHCMALQGCRRRPSDMCGRLESPHDVQYRTCADTGGRQGGKLYAYAPPSHQPADGTANGVCSQAKYLPEASSFSSTLTGTKLNILSSLDSWTTTYCHKETQVGKSGVYRCSSHG